MRKIVYICDHCGTELDESDYIEREIDGFAQYIDTDLCKKCYDELNNMALQYLNKKIML